MSKAETKYQVTRRTYRHAQENLNHNTIPNDAVVAGPFDTYDEAATALTAFTPSDLGGVSTSYRVAELAIEPDDLYCAVHRG
jgi:hypothetical protein